MLAKESRHMSDNGKARNLARGEAKSRIHWGAEVEEVLELLRANDGIEGHEADAIVSEAVSARRSAIRKNATLALVFAVIGLSIPATYFGFRASLVL